MGSSSNLASCNFSAFSRSASVLNVMNATPFGSFCSLRGIRNLSISPQSAKRFLTASSVAVFGRFLTKASNSGAEACACCACFMGSTLMTRPQYSSPSSFKALLTPSVVSYVMNAIPLVSKKFKLLMAPCSEKSSSNCSSSTLNEMLPTKTAMESITGSVIRLTLASGGDASDVPGAALLATGAALLAATRSDAAVAAASEVTLPATPSAEIRELRARDLASSISAGVSSGSAIPIVGAPASPFAAL
mmetsp:Transcript_71631/g.118598  ORF Transcript_71631/g.118598 Transcript_71631/m.118598 type:complete len:247 (+) Transcript_71631:221-961(+)